jgi:cytoskeletal protein CcmA (bactofilin family)
MKKEKQVETVSTFLGAETGIEGTLAFKGAIRLDGKVNGKIVSQDGTAIIGEKAQINAEIRVAAAIVKGEVNGSIEATQRIEVYPPARIIGDIQAPVISIASGVMFEGNCTMGRPADRPEERETPEDVASKGGTKNTKNL